MCYKLYPHINVSFSSVYINEEVKQKVYNILGVQKNSLEIHKLF